MPKASKNTKKKIKAAVARSEKRKRTEPPQTKEISLAELSKAELTMRLGIFAHEVCRIQKQSNVLGRRNNMLQSEWVAISQELDKR